MTSTSHGEMDRKAALATAGGVTSDVGVPATVRHQLARRGRARMVPPRVARAALQVLLGRLRNGTVQVRDSGRMITYGEGEPYAELDVQDPSAWSLVAQRGSIGLGEAYVDGLIETPDLAVLLRVLARNAVRLNAAGNRLAPLRDAVAAPLDHLRRRSSHQDRRNVIAHYDVGDDFFELFLDSTMAYSCGVFGSDATTLEEASIAKFERICAKLDLCPSDHLVEVGSGWGGFAVHAAATRGCRVTTTTISDRQYAATRTRVAAAGLGHLVSVLNVDYRDLAGTYSHLVSVEMIEAVDWRDHDAFFATIDRLVDPGGRAVLQCILIGDRDFDRAKRHEDFLGRYIFPGGCLPSLGAITSSLSRTGALSVVDYEDLGAHYVRTLKEWRRRLEDRWSDALALGYEERFLRLWRFYLCYCEAAFADGHVTNAQLVLEDTSRRCTPRLLPR